MRGGGNVEIRGANLEGHLQLTGITSTFEDLGSVVGGGQVCGVIKLL